MRIESSVTSLSWIPSEAVTGLNRAMFESGVAHYDEELAPRIRGQGLTIGQDFFLVFSPEREDPGNAKFSTRSIPKVCGGTTPNCQEVGVTLYGKVIDRVVPVSSTRVAESSGPGARATARSSSTSPPRRPNRAIPRRGFWRRWDSQDSGTAKFSR